MAEQPIKNNESKDTFAQNYALLLTILCFTYLGAVTFITIPSENKEIMNMILIAVLTALSTAYGYIVGSSKGSADKNNLLNGK